MVGISKVAMDIEEELVRVEIQVQIWTFLFEMFVIYSSRWVQWSVIPAGEKGGVQAGEIIESHLTSGASCKVSV